MSTRSLNANQLGGTGIPIVPTPAEGVADELIAQLFAVADDVAAGTLSGDSDEFLARNRQESGE